MDRIAVLKKRADCSVKLGEILATGLDKILARIQRIADLVDEETVILDTRESPDSKQYFDEKADAYVNSLDDLLGLYEKVTPAIEKLKEVVMDGTQELVDVVSSEPLLQDEDWVKKVLNLRERVFSLWTSADELRRQLPQSMITGASIVVEALDVFGGKDLIGIEVAIDKENQTDQWWEAARVSDKMPEAFIPLMEVHEAEDVIVVSEEEAEEIQAWAETLPGWGSGAGKAPYPIKFDDILGQSSQEEIEEEEFFEEDDEDPEEEE